ncbi:MAG: putative adenylate cyclase [Myxococcales bacterium]|nr:putative adenylate cyclase [Myxococcales bacterium]
MLRASIVAVVVTLAARALAAEPVVAVMPFRDLSGARANVGEAIRETLTVDLKEVGGVRVVERGAIDKVIGEQNLEDKKRDLSPIGAVRVGTLVGATWIVMGAYQRAGGDVRLTARIVEVASGELKGSAKVDGGSDELLRLQDGLAISLFQSAGLAPKTVQRLARRARPRVPYRAFQLYGDAVQAPDDDKRRALLQEAVAAGPQLHYAVRDLEALQKRMGGYSAAASAKLEEREKQLVARADDAARPAAERTHAAHELLSSLAAARRYHALAEVSARWQKSRLDGVVEPAAWSQFRAEDGLHRWDAALAAGEQYLKALPTGEHFREIETRMHAIVEERRKRASRRAEYAQDLAEKRANRPGSADQKLEWDYAPCICARWNSQLDEVMLDSCSTFITAYQNDARPDARDHVLAARFFVILALAERGDFARARPRADALLADSDEWDEELRKLMSAWPTD